MSSGSARGILAAGSTVRLGYALGLLLAPDAMARWRLAPRTPGNPYARMTTRAFGAVHANVALLSLRAAGADRDVRLSLRLNVGCDVGDLVATWLEWRAGNLPRVAGVGSTLVQSGGIATWITALRRP